VKEKKVIKYAIMFSSAGVGEAYLEQKGFECVVANELEQKRADFHKYLYPNSHMVYGDICEKENFDEFINISIEKKVEFLLATPPCQGFSLSGKNKSHEQMTNDDRNFLIFKVFEAIERLKPKYILIENVPRFLKLIYALEGDFFSAVELLKKKFGNEYIVDHRILNAMNYGVPQSRKRAFIKLYKKGLSWDWPTESKHIITVRDAIEHLPSIESGQTSQHKLHFGRKHNNLHILWMTHTPTGQSAFKNKEYYPKDKNGNKINGYHDAYARMSWDKPAPTITIRSDAISSNSKVHPGRKRDDSTYSDARVLSILELLILASLPEDWSIPDWASEILVRQIIGESVPPLLVSKILEKI
jgi:DNA (cytosine-5)-methyltransferase 1